MLQKCFKRSDVKVACLRQAMREMSAAKEMTCELEEAKRTIDDLKKEKTELSSVVDASKNELAAQNKLLAESLDANVALMEDNTRLSQDLKGTD